jgi:hypothetical protein
MLHLSGPVRSRARKIIVDTVNGLVENGTIQSHRLASLKLAERKVTEDSHDNDGFVFITDDQAASLAKRVGVCVWLQRTMGLRIGEALGVTQYGIIASWRISGSPVSGRNCGAWGSSPPWCWPGSEVSRKAWSASSSSVLAP